MFSISGWFRASNNLIYKRFTDFVNYETAKDQCDGMGARLVSTGIRNNTVKKYVSGGLYYETTWTFSHRFKLDE